MLLGLNGIARSGKDTFGEMLAQKLGYETYALASPIKGFINSLFGWDERMSDGILKEEEIYTQACNWPQIYFEFGKFKGLMDNAGIEYESRNLPDKFVKILKPYSVCPHQVFQWKISPRKAYQLFGTEFGRECIKDSIWTDIAPKENVIWTDVRFDNESDAVLKANGEIIHVIRPGQNTIGESTHASEAGLTNINYFATIVNDGTLAELDGAAASLKAVLIECDEELSWSL